MKVEAMQEKLYELEVGGSRFYHHNHDDHYEHQSPYRIACLGQGCQRFETSVFFSEKINISTTGGSRVGFFQPDTNHP